MVHTMLMDTAVLNVHIGDFSWTLTQSGLIYLIIAAVVGFIAEFIVGWRLPLGFVGAILAALAGMWLMDHVLILNIPGDINIYGVRIIRALIGGIILVALWHLFTYRGWSGRGRYYRRRSYE